MTEELHKHWRDAAAYLRELGWPVRPAERQITNRYEMTSFKDYGRAPYYGLIYAAENEFVYVTSPKGHCNYNYFGSQVLKKLEVADVVYFRHGRAEWVIEGVEHPPTSATRLGDLLVLSGSRKTRFVKDDCVSSTETSKLKSLTFEQFLSARHIDVVGGALDTTTAQLIPEPTASLHFQVPQWPKASDFAESAKVLVDQRIRKKPVEFLELCLFSKNSRLSLWSPLLNTEIADLDAHSKLRRAARSASVNLSKNSNKYRLTVTSGGQFEELSWIIPEWFHVLLDAVNSKQLSREAACEEIMKIQTVLTATPEKRKL